MKTVPARLRSALAAARREGRLPPAEAAVLDDMLHAGWDWAPAQAAFAARYLPRPFLFSESRKGGLMAAPAELAAARNRARRDPLSAALLAELAQRAAEHRNPRNAARLDWRERRNPAVWNSRKSHWRFGSVLQELAWSSVLTGCEADGAEARHILLALARARQGWKPVGCNYGRPYHGWLNDNLLDLGHATLGPAIAYSLLRPGFSASERREIADYFEPFFYRALTWRYHGVERPGHNFAPVGYSGMGLLALALAPDIPAARRGILADTLAWAEAYARFTLDHVAGKDGAAVEGSAYGSASLYYIGLFAEGLLHRFGRNLFTHPAWGRFARYLAMETLPGGGAFNNFNDNHYRTHVGVWPLVAHRSGDPAGHWIWQSHQCANGAESWREKGQTASLNELPYVLLHREPAADALTPRALKLPAVRWFPDQQHLVLRTGWEKRDLHVSFQCTRGRKGGHNQADRLNITLYGLGERFVIDSGYGLMPIPGSTEVRRLGALAESHNQVLVDGKGQKGTTAPDACRILARGRKGSWAWLLADAAPAYQGVRKARRLLAVRLDAEAPLAVIADWVVPEAKGRHRFTWLLHTAPGNSFKKGDKPGAWTIQGTAAALRLFHRAEGAGKTSADTWIDHPRLRAEAAGNAFLAISILGTETVRETAAPGRRLLAWDGPHPGSAALAWRNGPGGPAAPRLTLAPLGLTLPLDG